MIELIPSVVPHDKVEMLQSLSLIHSFTHTVQLDIDDDTFTSRATLQSKDIPRSALSGLSVEVHLMVADVARIASEWIPRMPKRLILHAETHPNAQLIQEIAHAGIVPVIAKKAESPNSIFDPYTHLVDSFLFLSVSPIGEQGGVFQPHVIRELQEFHNAHPSYILECDGGVNDDTLESVVRAGATRLVVGSALFHAKNSPEEQFRYLSRRLQQLASNQ